MTFANFSPFQIEHDGVRIHGLKGGSGAPLLLLHGHPQTHMIWHLLAGPLAEHFTVIVTDLRGYGASSKPRARAHGGQATETVAHALYSKRAMAADQLAVMRHFGYEQFFVCAHDRGARVAHRMAADYPQAVERLMLLDIAPTLTMYESTDRAFATAYFHWFFLIQPAPFPEALLAAQPDAYVEHVMSGRHAGLEVFAPEALAAYKRAFADPDTIHAICEDYRAAASIDLEHDRDDRERGRKLACPVRVLWGEHGVIEACFDALAAWRSVARDVSGQALPCGHYIPEEVPRALYAHMMDFFTGQTS